MKIATLLKEDGNRMHFDMDPPLPGYGGEGSHRYVIASSVAVFGEPECLVFPSNAAGDIVSWGDIAGSKGTLSHQSVIEGLGYTIVRAA